MLYTLAITSCDRHDLLQRTLRSLADCINHPPAETIIYEDGPKTKPEWLDSLFPRLGRVRWINSDFRRGQSYAIDRLYREIKTEYIFWCEDDWEFTEGYFLQQSKQILDANPKISMVAVRDDWNHPLVDDPRGFKIAEPYWKDVWGGACWNPGLRRLSDFKRYGSYGRHVGYGTGGLGHEATWSKLHLDDGFRIAALPSHCHHIGDQRSRSTEPLDIKFPKVLIAIPACRDLAYGKWESEDSPHYDKANTPYCKDIHISRPNDRIQVVRETWFKDIQAFPHCITGKFFFGAGSAVDGEDSVVLPVPDDYEHLPQKTQAICRWALANGFDYVFKCDDDTAVYVERLFLEVMELFTQGIPYAGNLNGEVCTGGPGYFLDRRAMGIVANGGQMEHWAEDVSVCIALGHHAIVGKSLSGHIAGWSTHWIFPKGFTEERLKEMNPGVVTMHAMRPQDLRDWYARRDVQ